MIRDRGEVCKKQMLIGLHLKYKCDTISPNVCFCLLHLLHRLITRLRALVILDTHLSLLGLWNHLIFRWQLLMRQMTIIPLERQQFLLVLGRALKEVLVISEVHGSQRNGGHYAMKTN